MLFFCGSQNIALPHFIREALLFISEALALILARPDELISAEMVSPLNRNGQPNPRKRLAVSDDAEKLGLHEMSASGS